MARNPVGWFEIYVKDIARARRFYEGVLGVSLERMPTDEYQMWAWPMSPDGAGAPGALVESKDAVPGSRGTIVYFVCDDCAVQESRVAQHGGHISQPKASIGEWGFMSLVIDPDGNAIGLHSMK